MGEITSDYPFFARDEVRELDRQAVDSLGVPTLLLMENAGRSLSEAIALTLIRAEPNRTPVFANRRFLILCGKGNNGGDGFVLARRLVLLDSIVHVVALAEAGAYTGDAAVNLRILEKMLSHNSRYFDRPGDTGRLALDYGAQAVTDALVDSAEWIVDAMLGTGAAGAPRAPYDELIRRVNASGKPIFAVDLPSGLDADTGQASGEAIQAKETCTLAAVKPGLLAPNAERYVGHLVCGDIGVPVRRN